MYPPLVWFAVLEYAEHADFFLFFLPLFVLFRPVLVSVSVRVHVRVHVRLVRRVHAVSRVALHCTVRFVGGSWVRCGWVVGCTVYVIRYNTVLCLWFVACMHVDGVWDFI